MFITARPRSLDPTLIVLLCGKGHACCLILKNESTDRPNPRMPPGKNMDGFLPMLVSGMNRFNFWLHLSKEGRKRFFDDFLPILHDAKHDVLKTEDDNSWYLVYIGTKPESRGKGYAGDLIRYTTKKVFILPA